MPRSIQSPNLKIAPQSQLLSQPGLPDFSWYNLPKRGKIYHIIAKYTATKYNATKYTKWQYNVINSYKIYHHFPFQTLKIYPNWDFWFEYTSPGNPGLNNRVPDTFYRHSGPWHQGCQIFLVQTYQNGKNISIDHKLHQTA
jgi:hypothetical protein